MTHSPEEWTAGMSEYLAVLSEGFCPRCKTRLSMMNTLRAHQGLPGMLPWCGICNTWWQAEERRITAYFPPPVILSPLQQRLSAKQAERTADPGYRPRPDSDWRDQTTCELEDLTGEGHGGTGQAGRDYQ